MSKGLDEIGEMIRLEMERFMYAELLHHFRLSLEEVKKVCEFAKTLYISERTPKEVKKKSGT